MSTSRDDLEHRLRDWMNERGMPADADVERVRGAIQALPARSEEKRRVLRAAAAIILFSGLAALLVGSGLLGIGDAGGPPGPTPPDPAAFDGDARLVRCLGSSGEVLYAFEMAQARDYWLHLPEMLLSPELEVDDPAFVVVYRGLYPGVVSGAPPPPGQTRAPRSVRPGQHDLCVLVGRDPATAEMHIYGDVSIAGLRAELTPEEQGATPPPTLDPQAEPIFGDYPGTPWTDRDRQPVDGAIIRAIRGPAHCGWQSAALVHVGWPLGQPGSSPEDSRQYVRDPEGVLDPNGTAGFLGTYDSGAAVPDDAIDTGYRYGWVELWISPSTVDREIYLARPGTTERLPRDPNWLACR